MSYRFESNGRLKAPAAAELEAADRESAVIVLNRGALSDHTPYWAYIAVKPSRYAEFTKAVAEHRVVTLQDYGTILRYGFEKEVPAAVRADMRREWGFDENFVNSLMEDILHAQAEFLKAQEKRRLGDIVSMLRNAH